MRTFADTLALYTRKRGQASIDLAFSLENSVTQKSKRHRVSGHGASWRHASPFEMLAAWNGKIAYLSVMENQTFGCSFYGENFLKFDI